MKSIQFHAVYLPEVGKFRVEIRDPERRWVELMTEERFLNFVLDRKGKMVVSGATLQFPTKETQKEFKKYFRDVAVEHLKTKGKKQ